MRKKTKRKVPLAFNSYNIIGDAVETGCLFGVNRLWKHRDKLTYADRELYANEVASEVMNALCEVIKFEED